MGIRKRKPTDDGRAKKVKKAIKPLLVWIGALQQWRVTVSFADELQNVNRANGIATVHDAYPYRHIDIQFVRAFVDRADARDIEETATHEILHVFLSNPIRRYLEKKGMELDEEYSDLEESLVELPTMWLERLRPDKGFEV